ncbi:MAG: 2-amino-4-hydroxy-6-hydroxymethyldihydropteridine diphosphokinase [Deltaproteobacteria bacterium CG11_big_fil_rev_8_21_14_0_20_47_16]|nr:MAG: 2-amino-4-hydroxy-6-hydroxymethyldihydropteridine diphosphokinase [Deltaproteobacteria bacterium CG11_big_fil_rev_8_21_14_0_20_47_16]
MTTALIAIGSNQGQPLHQCQAAVEKLGTLLHTTVTQQSPWYQSAAVTLGEQQDDYINGVVELETALDAEMLLLSLQSIEQQMGRPEHHAKWSPRCIDLDILSYGDTLKTTPTLTLPHPEIPKRLFVLLPLRDIAPTWIHPKSGETIDQLIHTCQREHALQIEKISC